MQTVIGLSSPHLIVFQRALKEAAKGEGAVKPRHKKVPMQCFKGEVSTETKQKVFI